MNAPTRVGFACVWDPQRESTWSYTPWQLRTALARVTTICDVGVDLSPIMRRAWQLSSLRRRDGQWVEQFQDQTLWRRYLERRLRRAVDATECDVVLEIQDLAVLDRPYFTYQDLTVDAVLELYDNDPGIVRYLFPHLDRAALLRLRDRQHRVYDHATGVLAMSKWLAGTLVKRSGLPRAKVHVVHPGVNIADNGSEVPIPARPGPRRRLLFIGGNFMTKGGDLVLAAFAQLRADYDPELRLTVAGPARWPLEGAVPPGVDFRGRVPVSALRRLYDEHDLFVMPSRMEAFGIVFLEALSRGLPCIGRNAYAMPEIITHGLNGALVDSDDVTELATAIASVLDSDPIYERCMAEGPAVARNFTWERAARDVLAAIG